MMPGNGPLPSGAYSMAWTVSSPLLYETDLPVAAKEESAKQRIRAGRVFTVRSSQIVFGQRRRGGRPPDNRRDAGATVITRSPCTTYPASDSRDTRQSL